MTRIETIMNEGFEQAIAKDIVIVDFGAPWCSCCRSQEPIIENIAKKFQDRVKTIILNIDNFIDVATGFNIKNIPTLIIFYDGEECKRFIGVHPENVIAEALQSTLTQYRKIKKGDAL